jgi:hypothetical protein
VPDRRKGRRWWSWENLAGGSFGRLSQELKRDQIRWGSKSSLFENLLEGSQNHPRKMDPRGGYQNPCWDKKKGSFLTSPEGVYGSPDMGGWPWGPVWRAPRGGQNSAIWGPKPLILEPPAGGSGNSANMARNGRFWRPQPGGSGNSANMARNARFWRPQGRNRAILSPPGPETSESGPKQR